MQNTKDHPVWDVYDLFRTSRLNIKYYGHKLSIWKKINCFTQVSLVIGAPSSAIAGLFFWDNQIGEYTWKILSSLTAVVACLHPVFKISDNIESYEKTVHGYRIVEHQIDKIVLQIKQDKCYSEKHRTLLEAAKEMVGKLKENDPEFKVNKKLQKIYQNEVVAELPVDNFYIPQEEI